MVKTTLPMNVHLTRDEFAKALRCGQGRAFLHVQQHGLEGVADLVFCEVTEGDESAAESVWVVVDFKTDQVESLQALQELYARQLELYRRALARVPGFEQVPIDVYLLSTHLQRRLLFAGPTT